MTLPELFADRLKEAAANGLSRDMRFISSSVGRTAVVDGKETVIFCSNNYLGLANHPAVIEAVTRTLSEYGWGACASRLLAGTLTPHVELEEKIAEFLDTDMAALFSTGYNANMAVLTALLGKGDLVIADRLVHASIIDGIRLSGAALERFAHNDMDDLDRILTENIGNGKRLVITEGVFSMDGDMAPLRKIATVAENHGAYLMVDDAHGFGVIGEGGRGVVEAEGLLGKIDIHVIGFGKAAGASGGVVAGSRKLIKGLIQFGRPFIYSTAPPPAAAAAASAAIDIIGSPEGELLRKRVLKNAKMVSRIATRYAPGVVNGGTPIIPLKLPSLVDASTATAKLLARSVFVPAIRPPTVPPGTERLRISVTAAHTADDIALLDAAIPSLVE
jgi:glycine C-acetyltransferase